MRDAQGAAENAARLASRRLAAKLAGLSDTAKSVRSTGFHVPTLDEDPGADFPTNLWKFDDGRLRVRADNGTVHEFLPAAAYRPAIPTMSDAAAVAAGYRLWFNGNGELRGRLADGTVVAYAPIAPAASSDGGDPTAGGSTSTTPKPSDPRPVKFRKTYTANWGRSFCPVHGAETGPDLYYGDSTYSTHHGLRRVMLGFDDGQIRADLAGSSIVKVEVHALNTHAHYNGGVDIHWGGHNVDNPPGGFSAVRRNVFVNHWPKVGDGAYWRGAPLWFGRALRDNDIKGLTIEQPNGSNAYYGRVSWGSIRIRITAVK